MHLQLPKTLSKSLLHNQQNGAFVNVPKMGTVPKAQFQKSAPDFGGESCATRDLDFKPEGETGSYQLVGPG